MTSNESTGKSSDGCNAASVPEREYAVFSGVSRGPGAMRINGKIRPAYEWCEMFGHVVAGRICERCGGMRDDD